MQCHYDYGYDYEYAPDWYAPIESCEEVIIEDILSAADCSDLCYDDWDCADWDFIEDEMKCVHKPFVSNDHSLFFSQTYLFNHLYKEKFTLHTFFFFSVMNL